MAVDTTYGVRIEDPYQWMETPDSPELLQWIHTQGDFARARLDALPERAALLQRIHALSEEAANPFAFQRRGRRVFYLRLDKGQAFPRLFVRTDKSPERAIIDPATFTGSEKGAGIDNYAASDDGSLIAFNVASGGGEISQIHVWDTATRSRRPDVICHVWSEFPANWKPDGTGFFYTQMSEASFRDSTLDPILGMRVRFHRLGTPPADDPVWLGPGVSSAMPFDPSEFPVISVPHGSAWAIAMGSGARSSFRLAVARLGELNGAATPWRLIANYEDNVEDCVYADSSFFLLSSQAASNRRILRLSRSNPDLKTASVVVPESRLVLMNLYAAHDGIYVTALDRGANVLYRLDYRGRWEEVPLPVAGTIQDLVTDIDQDGAFFNLVSWTSPPTYYEWNPSSRRLTDLRLGQRATVDMSNIQVERVEVPSFDGTLVPLWILSKKGLKRDGRNPAILNAYGSYGLTTTPSYGLLRLAWLERGGVWAHAGVRGGGDKGEGWHLAGKGPNRPNGIRDFIACAEYLEKEGYTSPARLGATGGSAAGTLVGPAVIQRPDLFGAAVLNAAMLNAVRYLHGPNGANQSAEFGTPDSEAGVRSLLAMDATQAIHDHTKYPSIMLGVGLNDNRVPIWNSGKFAARLLANGSPVLIRTDDNLGHAGSSSRSQGEAWTADYYAFLFSVLGQ